MISDVRAFLFPSRSAVAARHYRGTISGVLVMNNILHFVAVMCAHPAFFAHDCVFLHVIRQKKHVRARFSSISKKSCEQKTNGKITTVSCCRKMRRSKLPLLRPKQSWRTRTLSRGTFFYHPDLQKRSRGERGGGRK